MDIIVTEIAEVALFLSGAYVTRTAEAEGTVVALLPRRVEKLTVTAEGGKIRSVSAREDEDSTLITEATGRVTLAIDELDADIVKTENSIGLIDVERAIYEKNYRTDRGDLKETVAYFTKAVGRTLKKRASLAARLKDLQSQRAEAEAQLDKLCGATEVTVEVEGKAKLTFTYFTPECGFSHRYKIRSGGGRLACEYVAELWQNTGEDWDAPVTLAATHPRTSAELPQFAPEQIFGEAPRQARAMMMRAAPVSCDVAYLEAECETEAEESEDLATVYRVHGRLESGAKLSLPLKTFEGEATLGRTALPYLDRAVYLTAETDAAPFGACADADVFIDGRPTGSSRLTRRGNKMLIPLGAEQNIYLDYRAQQGKTERIGEKASRVTMTSVVTVTSAKSEAAELVVTDRIPLSGHSLVKVEPVELSGGAMDPATGRVDWTITLAPGERKTLTLKYAYTKPDDLR